jgi:hypothetical protein
MLITLVAVLCNAQLCLEKVVTTSDQSGITFSACQVHGQIGIADWLAKGPYRDWKQNNAFESGKYVRKTKREASTVGAGKAGRAAPVMAGHGADDQSDFSPLIPARRNRRDPRDIFAHASQPR